jgi:hypothetical protein
VGKQLDAVRRGDVCGGMPVEDLLATYTIELAIHTMDVAHAVGLPERMHEMVAPVVFDVLDGRLGGPPPASWSRHEYVMKATGRAPLTRQDRDAGFPLIS